MKTLHPERDVTESRVDGDAFVYTVAGREVRVPQKAFDVVKPGLLGMPQRRMILAQAVKDAQMDRPLPDIRAEMDRLAKAREMMLGGDRMSQLKGLPVSVAPPSGKGGDIEGNRT